MVSISFLTFVGLITYSTYTMKQKRLLFSLMLVCLLLALSSCSEEDKRVFGDDFEVPELTDANTIQFTVDASGEWKVLEIVAGGGRIAIEWGDGRIQKVEHPDNTPIRYRYNTPKNYKIRVWAEEVNSFIVSGILIPVSDVRLGNFPRMERIDLNSIKGTETLDLNTSCPNLLYVNIGNWQDLENLYFDECTKLEMIQVYTNPKLTSLQIGNCEQLNSLYCQGNGLRSISLKRLPALRTIELTGTPQLSTLEVDDDNQIGTLKIEGCAFKSLTFLDQLTSLTELHCSSNELTELNISKNVKLFSLNCYHNQLSSLSIPAKNNLRKLDCRYNKLDKDQLNSVFNALLDITGHQEFYGKYTIMYGHNPGEENCDKNIPLNKHWQVN